MGIEPSANDLQLDSTNESCHNVLMIAIIDYQMGNLRSVQKAFEHLGHNATIAGDPEEVAVAQKVVLPGVGAFGDAMRELKRRHLCEPILEAVNRGVPFLGICLGLQLLFERSEESVDEEGLGIILGDVRRFSLEAPWKVPHMGWNQVRPQGQSPLIEGIKSGTHFYFVHSYYVRPKDDSWTALETDYGHAFCSMVARDNLFATQFHPEKSQTVGLDLLDRFARL